jgi:hypothetical protein
MRLVLTLGTAALFFLGATAMTAPAQDRETRLMEAQLERGHNELSRVADLTSNAARLQTLDRAIVWLRGARAIASRRAGREYFEARRQAESDLVEALVDESSVYLDRKSLPLARKRAREALDVTPYDPRAIGMLAQIDRAERTDIYDASTGNVAIQRIRERRAAAGLPLRDRGVANRR